MGVGESAHQFCARRKNPEECWAGQGKKEIWQESLLVLHLQFGEEDVSHTETGTGSFFNYTVCA